MGNQGFFFFFSPNVKDENCWIHSSAISSDPVHHSGKCHSWLAHAALLYFPCCSSASSRKQRYWRNRDAEKEQSSSTGRNLGARQKKETLQFPLLHLCGLCYCAAELETSIICFLAKDKQTTELPTTKLAIQSPALSDRKPGLEDRNCPNIMELFRYETFHPAVFKRRTKAVRRYWFQSK